jgi:hypothetical protein
MDVLKSPLPRLLRGTTESPGEVQYVAVEYVGDATRKCGLMKIYPVLVPMMQISSKSK